MKSRLLSSLIVLAGLSLILGSCLNQESITPYQQLQKDIAKINAYLVANPPAVSDVVVRDASGVTLVITERPVSDITGSEPVPMQPTPENIVQVAYVGRLLNGTQFDADDSYTFTLTNTDAGGADVISGWKIALGMMTEGMKATVYIPSGLAYGNRGSGSIGANQVLIFDLDLKEVDQSNEQPRFGTDMSKISAYLEGVENVIVHPNGFSYILESTGSGGRPDMYDQVKVKFTGKVLNANNTETTFAQDVVQGPVNIFSSRPANYIHGLALGLQLMQQGDKAKFYLPSALGYGPGTTTGVNANSNLVFEIELLEVTPN
jgi:FKBP-type peptidyl-prolyl cis-trans isomerase FkpA